MHALNSVKSIQVGICIVVASLNACLAAALSSKSSGHDISDTGNSSRCSMGRHCVSLSADPSEYGILHGKCCCHSCSTPRSGAYSKAHAKLCALYGRRMGEIASIMPIALGP